MSNIIIRSKKASLALVLSLLCVSFLFNAENSNVAFVSAIDSTIIDEMMGEVATKVKSEISESWYDVNYTMLLITPNISDYIVAAEEFAAWKSSRGIPSLVVSNFSAYEGRDIPEKIRNAIISYYEIYPIEWILLMGDTDLIPIRYVYNPDTPLVKDNENFGSEYLKPTDFYYADLTGNWNIDGDEYWGEHWEWNGSTKVGEKELDYDPEVYVGRFPANTISELNSIIDKTIFYENGSNAGDWMGRYVSISGLSNGPNPEEGDPDGEHEGVVSQYIIDNLIEGNMDWVHYYENSYYTPIEDSRVSILTKTKALTAINNGASILAYAGHGSASAFSAKYALSSSDVSSLTNYGRYSMIYADACSTNRFDGDTLGEEFVLSQGNAGIGYIGALRLSWYYPGDVDLEYDNRALFKLFMREMFENGHYQQGKALYESKWAYANSEWFLDAESNYNFSYFEMERKSLLTYALVGDPSVDIYTSSPTAISPLLALGDQVYEGGKYSFQLTDQNGDIVPNATLTLFSDNKYFQVKGGKDGVVSFFLPHGQFSLNYSIFAHNFIPVFGSFDVLLDDITPKISSIEIFPQNPTVSDKITITATLDDSGVGVCRGYLVFSNSEFANYTLYEMESINFSRNFGIELPLLDYGTYQYGIIAYDYMNHGNTTFYSLQEYNFKIKTPLQFYILSILNFSVVAMGIAAFVSINLFRKKKKLTELTLELSFDDILSDQFEEVVKNFSRND
ncbi:hypothetical protein NEF87_001584 [Candidatus Lokiarchaeum ossiferum]|uniref:Gingipain domain-containing protein n=1 Tax=Candidatus Lokiarchaeum ossiferum TaxID=2951803 RepID=A0ABY6HS54_9ARCH|nr:hypothetical protein NEF87_001584 [Candidatus Lokiarchaeum sp. B-35]